jgi:transposase
MKATNLQIRVRISEYSRSGLSDRRIAEMLKTSIHTVRKWRRKAQRGEALNGSLGRPERGALSSFSKDVISLLERWRTAHPGWGAKTLRAELRNWFSGIPTRLPSQASIGRWLKQTGRSRAYQKHSELPKIYRTSTQHCHEEWELDARGYQRIAEVGIISLINVNDVHSRVKIHSFPCFLGEKRACRRPTTEDYQLILRQAFLEWGLPDRLAVDHDSVFFDNRNASPFPTRFHLWLIALGIDMTLGRPGRPTDQGMTERSHQTWFHQVLEGQTFSSYDQLLLTCQQRRTFLNHCLPCATLGEEPPLVAFPEALTPRRLYRPEYETQLLSLDRVYTYLAKGSWFRLTSNVGAIKLGQAYYSLGPQWKRKETELTFDPDQRLFICRSQNLEKRFPLKGISVQFLMGELGSLAHLSNVQLLLPFSWDQWRLTQSYLVCSGMTY